MIQNAPTFPDVRVVGMHFREREGVPARALVSNLIPPADLEVEREPHNAYDSFAIKVLIDGQHIGYIEASQARWIAPWMDKGVDYLCVCTDLQAVKNNLHPIVKLVPADYSTEEKTEDATA